MSTECDYMDDGDDYDNGDDDDDDKKMMMDYDNDGL